MEPERNDDDVYVTALLEVDTILNETTLFKEPRKLVRDLRGLSAKSSKALASTADLVRKLAASFAKSQTALDFENSTSEGAKQLLKLEDTTSKVQANVAELEASKATVQQEVSALQREIAEIERAKRENTSCAILSEAEARRQKELNARIPPMKYAIGLYSNITKIQWDDARCDVESGGRLSGLVVDSSRGKMVEFDLKDKTDFQAANELWAVVGSA